MGQDVSNNFSTNDVVVELFYFIIYFKITCLVACFGITADTMPSFHCGKIVLNYID